MLWAVAQPSCCAACPCWQAPCCVLGQPPFHSWLLAASSRVWPSGCLPHSCPPTSQRCERGEGDAFQSHDFVAGGEHVLPLKSMYCGRGQACEDLGGQQRGPLLA
eukprot:scaffold186397_cov16-Tisochrysis_lutea.AAC.3